MLNDFIYYTTTAILLYQILRAGWHWGILFVKFMFDEGLDGYNPKLEKPRLFFHLITITFSVVAFVQLGKPAFNPSVFIFIQLFYLLVVVFFGVMFQITWCKIFETRFIPIVRNTVSNFNKPPKPRISQEQGEKLYDRLINFGFLIYDNLDDQIKMKSIFVEVLKSGNVLDKQLFRLHMNNIQTCFFYKKLKTHLNSKFTLRFVLSVFENKNGSPSEKSVRESYDNRKVEIINRQEDIERMFEDLS